LPCGSATASSHATVVSRCCSRLGDVADAGHRSFCVDCDSGCSSVAPFAALSVIVGSSSGRYGDAMTDGDDDEEFEPLEVVPVPVPINAHDPEIGGPSVVRLFFSAGAYEDWPGGGLANVLVIEDWDRVSIGLVRREVEGDAPDATGYGESLKMGRQVSLDVALSRSLGTRSLLDASTGEVVPRVKRQSEDPLPAEAMGTPRWRWS
jgi:hypothetical protein